MDVLAASQEVKGPFGTRLWTNNNVQTDVTFAVLKEAAAGSESQQVYVCFMPVSQQFKTEAARKCCATTDTAGVCANAEGLAGTAAEITGFDVCDPDPANVGLVEADNYLCLP